MSLTFNAWRTTTLKTYDSVNGLQTIGDHTNYTMWTAALAVGDYIYFENGGWYDTPAWNIRLEVGTVLAVTSASFELQYMNSSSAWVKIDDVASTVFTIAGQTTITWTMDKFVLWLNQGPIRIVCTAADTPTQACVSATSETVTGDGQFYISGSTENVDDMLALSTTEEAVTITSDSSQNPVYEVKAIITLNMAVANSIWEEIIEPRQISMVSYNAGRGIISWRTKNSGNASYVKFGKLTNDASQYGVNYVRQQLGSTYATLMAHNGTYYLYGSSIKEESFAAIGMEGRDSLVDCTGRFSGNMMRSKNITFTNQDRIESQLLDLTITGTSTTALTRMFYDQVWKRCSLTNYNVEKYYGAYRSTYFLDCDYTAGQLHKGAANMFAYECYTHFIKVVDTNGDGIDGATITCTDVNDSAANVTAWGWGPWTTGGYTVTTNVDGYAGLWHGDVTGAGDDYFEDSTAPWVWNVANVSHKGYHALWTVRITSGTGEGQVRDFLKTGSSTSTRMYVIEDWDTNPDATSKYVIFPILFRRYWNSATPTNLYPFDMVISKAGYFTNDLYTNEDLDKTIGQSSNTAKITLIGSGFGDTNIYDSTLYDTNLY